MIIFQDRNKSNLFSQKLMVVVVYMNLMLVTEAIGPNIRFFWFCLRCHMRLIKSFHTFISVYDEPSKDTNFLNILAFCFEKKHTFFLFQQDKLNYLGSCLLHTVLLITVTYKKVQMFQPWNFKLCFFLFLWVYIYIYV